MTIVLASALLIQLPVLAQTDEESAEGTGLTVEGTVARPPEEDGKVAKATSLTAAIPADSGVSVQTLCTNCNNANLTIAGFGNEHVALICDGIVVPSGLAQIYLLSVMPPTRIDKVSVEKGAGDPTLVGGAIGGGIKIERVKPKDGVTLNASADAGSYDWGAARFDITGRSGWFGGYFVGTYSESDSIDANLDGWADTPEFNRHTAEMGFDLTPGKAHRLRFGFARYIEDQFDGPSNAYFVRPRACVGLDQVIGNDPCTSGDLRVGYNREDVQLDREQYDLRYDLSLKSGTKVSLIAALAERSQDIQETRVSGIDIYRLEPGDEQRLMDDYGLTPEQLEDLLGITLGPPAPPELEPTYFIDDENSQLSVTVSQPIGQQSMIRAGAAGIVSDFAVVDVLFNYFASLDPGTQIKEKLTEVGFWVEGETALGPRIELLLGLRYTEFVYEDNEAEINELTGGAREPWLSVPLPEGNQILPRVALTWKALEDLQFRFSAGNGLRAPAPAFDRVCCGRRYRGNRGVFLEESTTYGLEATYQPGPRWRVGFSTFHSDFDDQILNMATWSDNPIPPLTSSLASNWVRTYQNVNMENSRIRSVSLDGKFQAPIWLTTRVSYTWLDPENLSPGGAIHALLDRGSDPVPVTYFYDGVPYTTDRRGALGFDFSLRPAAMLSLKVQYTGPMLIQQYVVNSPANVTGIADDLAETEDFWLANLRFSRSFLSGMTIYAGIDNVLGYVQGHGCTGNEAQANPNLVGCLGDPRFDFNWGPLRGRYYYAGLSYQFVN